MQYESTTTLRRIRDARPCRDGWTKLLDHLGKTEADDEPLALLTVLDSNGIDDALWVLTFAMPDDRLARQDKDRASLLSELRDLRQRVLIALSEAEIEPPHTLGGSERAAYRRAVDDIRAALRPVTGPENG